MESSIKFRKIYSDGLDFVVPVKIVENTITVYDMGYEFYCHYTPEDFEKIYKLHSGYIPSGILEIYNDPLFELEILRKT